MVGVLDVLAVEVGSLAPVVALEVFLGEFTLSHCRVGLTLEELFEFLDGELLVYVEVCVGIFHVAFRVVGVVCDGVLVFGGCCAEVRLVGKHIALENVDRRIGILRVLAGFVDVFLDIFSVGHRVGVVISAGDGDRSLGVFLCVLLCHLELILGSVELTVEKVEGTNADVVVCVLGIDLHTLLEVGFRSGLVALSESNLTEIVVGQSLVGFRLVESTLEDFLGVVELAGLVVFNTVLVALRLGGGHQTSGQQQRKE